VSRPNGPPSKAPESDAPPAGAVSLPHPPAPDTDQRESEH
jgi:hypothetical protein